MGPAKGFAIGILAWAIANPAAAYYHYIHYSNRTSPYLPIAEKFDLNTLPNKTVAFLVSDQGPAQFAPNDSFAAVLGQIRLATQAWNSVSTSDLRVAFGGLSTTGTPQSSPGGDIVFVDDLPPGVLAVGGPTSKMNASFGPSGMFIPIVRATVRINRDLTQRPGPSNTEAFFETVVHEMGHALGLQHTFTSSAMSVAVTRATYRAKPITADDVAGISLLYPSAGFAANFGSVSGRVTSNGQGVHLASVVAIRPSGTAVSAVTNPDGTYRIDGLPPDTYWVYVHPMPPPTQDGLGPGDIVLPLDPGGMPVPPDSPYGFETLFYPGTRDVAQFTAIPVNRGSSIANINFNVQRRDATRIYDVSTYSYFNNLPAQPAFLSPSLPQGTIVAVGAGLTSGTGAAPGLGVQFLGGFASLAPYGPRPYSAMGAAGLQTFLALDLSLNPFSGVGPRHLMFTVPDDAYVLPNGLNLVQKQPPMVLSVIQNPDGTATVSGINFSADSLVYFDGLPAATRSFSGNDVTGTLTVTPPAGFAYQQATVVVYGSDGQNSGFAQQQAPSYYYGPSDPPFVSITPSSLPAGATAMVDVTGINTKFVDGQTVLGIGSTDISVRRVWVMSPTHLVADIVVAPNAPPVASELSVVTGFQMASQPFAFQVLPANPVQPTINLPVSNAIPGQTGVFPGSLVNLTGSNLSLSSGSTAVAITLNDQPVNVLFATPAQVSFQIPAGFPTGPAVLKLNNGRDNSYPVVVQIDAGPPTITTLLSSNNSVIDASNPALAGDTVNMVLQNVDPSVVDSPSRLRLNEAGAELVATSIAPLDGQGGFYQVQFALSPSISGQDVALTVSVDGTAASPVFIPVRGL